MHGNHRDVCKAGHLRTPENVGLKRQCKECQRQRNKSYRKKNPDRFRTHRAKDIVRDMLMRSKSNAKRRGIVFTITRTDLLPLPTVCPVLGYNLDYMPVGLQNNAASIDRIDSAKGYLPGNVQVISYRANILKQNSTLHELKCLVRHMESITPED